MTREEFENLPIEDAARTVYVLESGLDYAGRNVVGVYATVEEARAAADAFGAEGDYHDELVVTDVVVGEAAEWPRRGWTRRRGETDWTR